MRPKLTFANVVSLIALFVALGGTSYAVFKLPKNSVGTKQLKKDAVTTAKLKKESVTGLKVKKGSLTGAQIDASTLGIVPGAATASHATTADSANALAPPEPWHVVGTPGEPPFMNGCEDLEAGDPATFISFYKDHEGVVHIEGYYECSSAGETAFQLPEGYRPKSLEQFALPFAGGGAGIAIFPYTGGIASGAVKCGSNVCDLNGVTFRAES
jgi:hypothetical protein